MKSLFWVYSSKILEIRFVDEESVVSSLPWEATVVVVLWVVTWIVSAFEAGDTGVRYRCSPVSSNVKRILLN